MKERKHPCWALESFLVLSITQSVSELSFSFAAGFLCKLETGCDFLRFFKPNRCRNPPYTVLFARKQTDTEGESCNIAFNILAEPRDGVCKTVECKISVLDQMLQNAFAFFL